MKIDPSETARETREDKGPTNFLTELDVRYIDGHGWKVLDPFEYRLLQPDGSYTEFVRAGVGFITDFASIPALLKWRWPSPGGKWDKPAVTHDCLYRTRRVEHVNGSYRIVERDEADKIFLAAMITTGTREDDRWFIYQGVRVGGWNPWRKYRKEEEAERRRKNAIFTPPPFR